mmetsp:Transcript_12013/g.25401  ORF Transcript_12013/g.25401 Transcript_12013/m.25401 type:complete len:243 (-) Transcript_12013:945-1673(-)
MGRQTSHRAIARGVFVVEWETVVFVCGRVLAKASLSGTKPQRSTLPVLRCATQQGCGRRVCCCAFFVRAVVAFSQVLLPVAREWYDVVFFEFVTRSAGIRVNHGIEIRLVVFVGVAATRIVCLARVSLLLLVPNVFECQVYQKPGLVQAERETLWGMVDGLVGNCRARVQSVLVGVFFRVVLDAVYRGRRRRRPPLLLLLVPRAAAAATGRFDRRYKGPAVAVDVGRGYLEPPRQNRIASKP